MMDYEKLILDALKHYEPDLNKNSIPLGDLQPGGFYHVPTIKSLAYENDTVGHIKDHLWKPEEVQNQLIVRRVGYMLAVQLEKLSEEQRKQKLLPLVREIQRSIEALTGATPDKMNMDHFCKFVSVKEQSKYAGYEITISYNARNLELQ